VLPFIFFHIAKMNTLTIVAAVLFLAVAGVYAGMDCGIAGNCPNVLNRIGNAITDSNNDQAFCCRAKALDTPYCCNAADYAKYKWDRFTNSATSTKIVAGTTIGAAVMALLL